MKGPSLRIIHDCLKCEYCELKRNEAGCCTWYVCNKLNKTLKSHGESITPDKDCPYKKTKKYEFLLKELNFSLKLILSCYGFRKVSFKEKTITIFTKDILKSELDNLEDILYEYKLSCIENEENEMRIRFIRREND